MTQEAAAPTLREAPTALELFTEYFARNYPGATGPRDPEGRRSDTLIRDPYWHAPKIFRAAEDAIRRAALAARPADPVEPTAWRVHRKRRGEVLYRSCSDDKPALFQNSRSAITWMHEQIDFKGWKDAWIEPLCAATPAEPSSRERWNAENPGELSLHTFDDDATPAEPSVRPDILERLTYHARERNDLSLDDCLNYLARGWYEVPGRTEREMVLQILSLLAGEQAEPSVRAALEELVACKDLKEKAARLHAQRPWPQEAENATNEYERRQPLAWKAARAALQESRHE